MATSRELIQLIARLFYKKQLQGKVLTYGVQGVEGQYKDIVQWLQREQYPYQSLTSEVIRDDKATEYETSVHQDVLFHLLGFSTVESLDFYPNENPTHVLDLNTPLPKELWGQYDLVYDGGTMEHCFNVPEVLFNTARLVKNGGYVIHINPVSGMLNHGFFQFSPTLYFDFYAINGFEDLQLKFILDGRYVDFDADYIPNDFLGEEVHIVFTARKTQEKTAFEMPIQNVYWTRFGQNKTASAAAGLSAYKKYIPSKSMLKLLLALRKKWQIDRRSHRL